MVKITGTYKLIKSENFDEYMQAIGVGWALRKLAAHATPSSEISQHGDEWKIRTWTTFKTTEISFRLGEEFDEVTADNRKVKATITQEGDNKLIHVQRSLSGGPTLTILREFADDGMTMTLEAPGGVKCTRVYNRIA